MEVELIAEDGVSTTTVLASPEVVGCSVDVKGA